LAYNQEDGKYYTEAGNPYSLEVGVYAGEKIEYNHGEETGVVLVPAVVKVLMEQANTPEAIAAGNWKIPFPLDARKETGLAIENWFLSRPTYTLGFFRIMGLSQEARFVSPFLEQRIVDHAFSPALGPDVSLEFPKVLSNEKWFLVFTRPEQSNFAREGEAVRFGDPILWSLRGEIDETNVPIGTQVLVWVSPTSLTGDLDITDNILEIGGGKVFLASST